MTEARAVTGDGEHILHGERKAIQWPTAQWLQSHMGDMAEGAQRIVGGPPCHPVTGYCFHGSPPISAAGVAQRAPA